MAQTYYAVNGEIKKIKQWEVKEHGNKMGTFKRPTQ